MLLTEASQTLPFYYTKGEMKQRIRKKKKERKETEDQRHENFPKVTLLHRGRMGLE